MKKIFIPILVLIATTIWCAEATAQTYKVIVNPDNPVTSISKSELSDIFLKKQTKWESGASIIPIDLGDRNPARDSFSKEVHGMGIGEVKTFWQQASFAGEGNPPLERSSDSDVINFVKSYPGAIGYVSAFADVSGVKEVTVN